MKHYLSFLQKDTVAIFLFHGVISRRRHQVRNYTRKHLPADDFASLISSLKEYGQPVSMQDIVEATNRQTALPKNAFAITFDDGFLNNLTIAAPILKQFQVPATFYVTSSFIEFNTMSWIDQIEYAFEVNEKVEVHLPNWQGVAETASQKIELLNWIRKYVKSNPNVDPYQFAQMVCNQIGVAESLPDVELDQKMNWRQLKELDADPLFMVGGHSHTHRILSYLPIDELQMEIKTSIELLEKNLNRKITHYSYPEGLSYCYSDEVINELRKHGVVCSPSAEYGINKIGDDLFHLKRILVT